MQGSVVAVSRSERHGVFKQNAPRIALVAGSGVEGDAHFGSTVKHRSRVARDPTQPNLRQVHLIHSELHDELATAGFRIAPGDMGENITTRGVDLLALSVGTKLHLGADAIVEVTGLRNPCPQLDEIAPGLMEATIGRRPDGTLIRRAGIMGVVLGAGTVAPGDSIRVEPPAGEHVSLAPV